MGTGRCFGITPCKVRLIWGGSEVLIIEKHISEIRLYEDVCPTLGERLGTGGGNFPMVVIEVKNELSESDRLLKPRGASR